MDFREAMFRVEMHMMMQLMGLCERDSSSDSEPEVEEDDGMEDSYIVKRYTNKEFLVAGQQQFIALEGGFHRVSFHQFGGSSDGSPNGPKVQLVPKNRVDIDKLKKNIGRPMKGKFFLCRCITRPHKMTSIMTVVDDPKGKKAVRLALYNYTSASFNLNRVLPKGLFLAIMNPWFKETADGGLTVRCDFAGEVVHVHPQQVSTLLGVENAQWAGEELPAGPIPIVNDTTTSETFFSSSSQRGRFGRASRGRNNISIKKSTSTASSSNYVQNLEEYLKLKKLGEENMEKKNFAEAIKFYSQAIELDSTKVDELLARSSAYLSLGCYNKALEDTTAVLEIQHFNGKGIQCHVKSLWGLNRYKEAVDIINLKFKQKKNKLENKKELLDLKVTAELLLRQSSTGEFDMVNYINAQKKQKTIDTAEYQGPVELKQNIPGKGRGLVATEAIKAGQLIICSKAFATTTNTNTSAADDGLNKDNYTLQLTNHQELVSRIKEKIVHDPELGKEFYKLYAGPQLGSISDESKTLKDEDMARIDKIVTFNAFLNAEKNSSSSLFGETSSPNKNNTTTTMGIYILPSYINHSCADSNCYQEIYGDVILIRALKQIKAGEEILIPYVKPNWSFDRRQEFFRIHEFVCNCSLCKQEIKEGSKVADKATTILKNLEELKEKDMFMDIQAAVKNISELESLRKNNVKLNFYLTHPIVWKIAAILHKKGESQLVVELLEKIHSVARDSVLAKEAVIACINIFHPLFKMNNRSLVNKWVKILKHDLLIAFGSAQVFPILGPNTVKILKDFGWNSFLKK